MSKDISQSGGRRGPPAGGSGGAGLFGMAVVVVILLIAVCVVIALMQRQRTQQPTQSAAAAAAGGEIISDNRMVYGGVPRARSGAGHMVDFEVLTNSAYEVGYSEVRRDPLWVAYRVFNNHGAAVPARPTGKFLTDTRTAAHVKHEDFTGSGYDRGHMAPNLSIARDYGAGPQVETFLLSNICPQSPALNEHVWERLENAERAYGDALEEVWVMDGPIFGDLNGRTTGHLASGIAVPEAFYKILVDEEPDVGSGGRHPRVMAVIMPQEVKGTELPQQYLTSVREIEQETQLEFFWKLDAATREALEGKVWPMWSVTK